MYTVGTMRTKHPRETIASIALYTSEIGISRCQNVTGFDRIGIPVYCAITPANPVLQVAWGKGCTEQDAEASALMEAVERSFLEEPHPHEQRMSQITLQNTGSNFLPIKKMPTYNHGTYNSESQILSWVPMYDFLQHTTCWVPASALHYTAPMLTTFTTNGLASGNSSEEAMLHGLFEIFERHAISSMFTDGILRLQESGGQRITLTGTLSSATTKMVQRLRDADIELILFSIPCKVSSVNVFWAVLHDAHTTHRSIAVSMGYGAHSSPEIAILKAIAKAAQTRVTSLHGCKEDQCQKITSPPSQTAIDRTVEYFKAIPETTALGEIPPYRPVSITNELTHLFNRTREAGYSSILSTEIPHSVPSVSIRKTIVPETRLNAKLF